MRGEPQRECDERDDGQMPGDRERAFGRQVESGDTIDTAAPDATTRAAVADDGPIAIGGRRQMVRRDARLRLRGGGRSGLWRRADPFFGVAAARPAQPARRGAGGDAVGAARPRLSGARSDRHRPDQRDRGCAPAAAQSRSRRSAQPDRCGRRVRRRGGEMVQPAEGLWFPGPRCGWADVFVHMETLRRAGLAVVEPGQRLRARIVAGNKGPLAVSVEEEA